MKFKSDDQRKAVMARLNVGNPSFVKAACSSSGLMTDSEANVRELYEMFIMNDERHYKRLELMNQNLARKKFRGIYDREKALKLYKYLVDDALKEYNRTYPTNKMIFSKEDKIAATKSMREDFEEQFAAGDYNKFKQKYLKQGRLFAGATCAEHYRECNSDGICMECGKIPDKFTHTRIFVRKR